MKKIRINELARELEVKPGVILEMLPILGVHEKKTHSSSVDEDVALELKRRLVGDGPLAGDRPNRTTEEASNGQFHDYDREEQSAPEEPAERSHAAASAALPAEATGVTTQVTPRVAPQAPAQAYRAPTHAAPPAATAHLEEPMTTAVQPREPAMIEQDTAATPAATPEAERPIPAFKPLRPRLEAGWRFIRRWRRHRRRVWPIGGFRYRRGPCRPHQSQGFRHPWVRASRCRPKPAAPRAVCLSGRLARRHRRRRRLPDRGLRSTRARHNGSRRTWLLRVRSQRPQHRRRYPPHPQWHQLLQARPCRRAPHRLVQPRTL